MIYAITHSKRRFQYLDPKPEDILIEDIAHALSNLCRFTGHTATHYSIAQHSIFVSNIVSPENALWGLMHDSAEAYVNDIASPLRGIINGDYERIHDLILSAIFRRYGLKGTIPQEVLIKDRWVTVNELWCLIDPDYEEADIPKLCDEIKIWPPAEAKSKFLERFNTLCQKIS